MTNITFKEYLEANEDYELFASFNEASWKSLLQLPQAGTRFAAGTVGNVIGQNLRGAGNIVGGSLSGLSGLGSAAIGSLQYLGGNKEAKEKAKSRIKSGGGDIVKGAGQVLRGATQVVASPITAPIRGSQAVDDNSMGGLLAPNDPKRGYWQDLFGLDSGVVDSKPKPESKAEPIATKQKDKKTTVLQKDFVNAASYSSESPKEWVDLVDRLRSVKSSKEGVEIVTLMKRKFPHLYHEAKKRALSLTRKRPSKDPTGRLRSGPSRRSPRGFPGL